MARERAILLNDGPGHGLHAIDGLVFHGDHWRKKDAARHWCRNGKVTVSAPTVRDVLPSRSHSDPHRELKKKFAHELADMLARSLEQNAYDRLIIVAPPGALGDLRATVL